MQTAKGAIKVCELIRIDKPAPEKTLVFFRRRNKSYCAVYEVISEIGRVPDFAPVCQEIVKVKLRKNSAWQYIFCGEIDMRLAFTLEHWARAQI